MWDPQNMTFPEPQKDFCDVNLLTSDRSSNKCEKLLVKEQESSAWLSFWSQPTMNTHTCLLKFAATSEQTGSSPAVIASEVAFCRCEWSVLPLPGTTARPASTGQNKHAHTNTHLPTADIDGSYRD